MTRNHQVSVYIYPSGQQFAYIMPTCHYAYIPFTCGCVMRTQEYGTSLSLSVSLSYTHTHTRTHKAGQVCCVVCIDYPLLSIGVFTDVYCVDVSIRHYTPAYGTLPPAHQLHGKAGKLLDHSRTPLSDARPSHKFIQVTSSHSSHARISP